MKECINCGNTAYSPYCPECGQKLEVRRVSLKGIINEFLSKWIGFDTQFGRTIVGMVIKPGEVVNSYLAGNRTKYIGPLGFLVVMTALLVISFDLFGLEVEDFLKENQSSLQGIYDQEVTEQQIQLQEKINHFVAKNFRFFAMSLIPFWGIALWFFYRKVGLNYIERLVVSTFLTSQGIWITILSLAVFALTDFLSQTAILTVSIFYYSYGLKSIFKRDNYFISLLKTIGSYIIAMTLFLTIVFVVGIVIVVIMVLKNPEMFQQG